MSMKISDYIPAKPVSFAITLEQCVKPRMKFRPATIMQLVGGKTWSLALIRVEPIRSADASDCSFQNPSDVAG